MLRFDRKQQNSVKQLPFNKKLINLLKKKKRKTKGGSVGEMGSKLEPQEFVSDKE